MKILKQIVLKYSIWVLHLNTNTLNIYMFTLLTTYLTAAFETVTLFGVSLIFFLVHDHHFHTKLVFSVGWPQFLPHFRTTVVRWSLIGYADCLVKTARLWLDAGLTTCWTSANRERRLGEMLWYGWEVLAKTGTAKHERSLLQCIAEHSGTILKIQTSVYICSKVWG